MTRRFSTLSALCTTALLGTFVAGTGCGGDDSDDASNGGGSGGTTAGGSGGTGADGGTTSNGGSGASNGGTSNGGTSNGGTSNGGTSNGGTAGSGGSGGANGGAGDSGSPDAGPDGGGAGVQTAEVGPAGGTFLLGDVTLDIPADAVEANVTITVEKIVGPGGEVAYRFGPEGTLFLKPIDVTLPVAAGTTDPTFYWTALGDTSSVKDVAAQLNGNELTASISHFSCGFTAPPVTLAARNSDDATSRLVLCDDSAVCLEVCFSWQTGCFNVDPNTGQPSSACTEDCTTAVDDDGDGTIACQDPDCFDDTTACSPSTCGDNVVDVEGQSGHIETCDDSAGAPCLTSCQSAGAGACGENILQGSPALCNTSCVFEPNDCVSTDGCCPAGCVGSGDKDCEPPAGAGAPCGADGGADGGGTCGTGLTCQVDQIHVNGYCTKACTTPDDCGAPAMCFNALPTGFCWYLCESDADCNREGYSCALLGPTDKVCQPN